MQLLRAAQRSKQILSAEEPAGNEVRAFGRMSLRAEDSKRFASVAKACVRDAARAMADDSGGGDMDGDESDGESDEVLHAEMSRRMRALQGGNEAYKDEARASGQEPEWLTWLFSQGQAVRTGEAGAERERGGEERAAPSGDGWNERQCLGP